VRGAHEIRFYFFLVRAYPFNFLAGAGRGGEQHTGSVRARLILDRGYFCRYGSRWPLLFGPARALVRVLARENQNTEHRLYYIVRHTAALVVYSARRIHITLYRYFFSFCPAPHSLHEFKESRESIEDLYTTASSKCFINISVQLFFFSSIQTTRQATGKNYMITYIARILLLLVRTGDNRLFAIVRAGFRLGKVKKKCIQL